MLCDWKLVDDGTLEGVVVLTASDPSRDPSRPVHDHITVHTSVFSRFKGLTDRPITVPLVASSMPSGPNHALGMPRSTRRSRTTCPANTRSERRCHGARIGRNELVDPAALSWLLQQNSLLASEAAFAAQTLNLETGHGFSSSSYSYCM